MEVYFDPQTFLRQRTGGISRLFTDLVQEFDTHPELGVGATLPFRISNNEHAATELTRRSIRRTPTWLPRSVLYAPWWAWGPRFPSTCDVVHHTYYSRRFLAAPGRVPQVTTVYDMIPELFTAKEGSTTTHLEKREYVESCDLVICISESTRRDMEAAYGPVATRTTVIPLSVQPGFAPSLPPVPGFPSEYLLYVGKRAGYKDFALLPQAMRLLRDEGLDIPLVVVGSHFTADERRELKDVDLLGACHSVALGDDELQRAYANCAALVQTSRYEGFGLTPLEAMASGVPTVIADSSSMPEVGGDVARYFSAGDPVSLAEELRTTLEDDALRVELGVRGLARAALFTPRIMAERTAAAYRSLVEDR